LNGAVTMKFFNSPWKVDKENWSRNWI